MEGVRKGGAGLQNKAGAGRLMGSYGELGGSLDGRAAVPVWNPASAFSFSFTRLLSPLASLGFYRIISCLTLIAGNRLA